jgi:CO/xanthine dehydrogenase Mo-binding subunit
MSTIESRTSGRAGVGTGAARPDGVPKVTGAFEYASDLWATGMLWGATLRSPHPHARIRSIDVGPALAVPGVSAVLTHDDVPGRRTYGLDVHDQPVLAWDVVRYVGEPVAIVAADHPDTARRAVAAIVVDYEVLVPLLDPTVAADSDPVHPDGNVFREMTIEHGDAEAVGDIVVEGTYEVGMQDQAPLGTEAGMARTTPDGGVQVTVATQWLHADQEQVAAALDLPEERVELRLGGVGGAFGAREDVSLQIHLALLARATGRPVKMVYGREESFLGHVHRHPAWMRYRHHARRDGTLVKIECELVLDGGAYTSTSPAVLGNAAIFSPGPYDVPNASVHATAVRTNNPPCGAMRGFGSVQMCFGHEAQMDKLAAALDIDPAELRIRNALAPGDRLITGQVVHGAAPVAELVRACADAPPAPDDAEPEPMALPGGPGRTTSAGDVRRGVGIAVGFKNQMFSEGFDDSAAASIALVDGVATVTTACAEVGQGFVTLVHQIVDEVLGEAFGESVRVELAAASTATVGSAGSTSASRQTWMSGGAVRLAAIDLAAQIDDVGGVEALAPGQELRAEVDHRHTPTHPLDSKGQGDAHVSWTFACHRATVDVDVDLGLVRLVDLVTSQEVGKILNPTQLLGQLEGGAAQGVGLALMEEIVVEGGRIKNPSFTDYLIPTALDLPDLRVAAILEEPEEHLGAPFGAKGVGEAPTISSGASVLAAIRDATGLDLTHAPVRPQDIAFARGSETGRTQR